MTFYLLQFLVSAALVGVQFYLYLKLRRYFAGNDRFRRLSSALSNVFILFSIPLAITLLYRAIGKGLPSWFLLHVMTAVYLWHFISLVLFALLMAGTILKLPFLTVEWLLGRFERTRPVVSAVRSNDSFRKFDKGRRRAVRQSFAIITGGVALGSAYEIYRPSTFEQSVIRLPIRNLPESFQGFSIGFISDIHSGIFMSEERMHSYAQSTNALGADMIVVGGDFVNLHLEEAYPFREAFKILSAPQGVFGVLGNHDYYTRKVDQVAEEMERTGISLLRNRYLTIGRNGDLIHLAGVDDTANPGTAEGAIRAVAGPVAGPIPKILLCHRPYFFPQATSAGFDLVLSGHTHGGQVVLGTIGRDVLAPARIFSPYVSGLYTEGGSKMYISRGLGTVSIPFRLNCPPEITKIILVREGTVASQAL
jgi:predicted MPP superfamily phosphohydrolase